MAKIELEVSATTYGKLAFARLVVRQIADTLIRSVLTGLAQRRAVGDPFHELVNCLFVVKNHHSNVHQLGRDWNGGRCRI